MAACTAVGPKNAELLEAPAEYDWQLPPGFTLPPVPVDNPVTADKARLGRQLFYDTRLSVNGQSSCAACHQQRLAFTDGRPQAIGATGELHARSSMSLVNVAYNNSYTWASRDTRSLEAQILIPMFNEQPIELGLRGREELLIAELAVDPLYAELFERAFPQTDPPVSIEHVVKSLATFVRTIIAADSAFDRRLYKDNPAAMSESALRGMRLFYSDQLNCGACHEGQNLAGGQHAAGRAEETAVFHNTGLYNVGNLNRYPDSDSGLQHETRDPADNGKFRAPSLRNIALTAPYMHDGSIATLAQVIDHYAAGGRTVSAGPDAGVGRENSNKSPLLSGFELNPQEKEDLLGFLDSLSDYSVLDDSRFSAPAGDE